MRKLLVLLLLLSILGWAQSPFDGTWKIDLNQAKTSDKPQVLVLESGKNKSPASATMRGKVS